MNRSRLRAGGGRVTAVAVVLALSGLVGCSGRAADEQAGVVPASACQSSPAALRALGARISGAITQEFQLSYTDEFRGVRAVLVSVCGRKVLERYEKSTAADFHDVASVTKSVVSTLVGLALADGSLHGLDEPLTRLLPDHVQDMSPEVGAITLSQLLTMTAGLDEDLADSSVGPWIGSTNFVKGILRDGVHHRPGLQFGYSSATSHVLAAVLVRATGRPLLDYAREKLFDPLGITTRPAAQPLLVPASAAAYDRAGFAWPVDHQGVNFGGSGLKLTPPDMAKLGQLYLDGGRWHGRQLLPAAWVHDATTARVPAGSGLGGASYGYQWWVTTAADEPAFAAVGYGGQLIEVVPHRRLVVVFSTALEAANPVATVSSDVFEDMVSRVIAPAVTP